MKKKLLLLIVILISFTVSSQYFSRQTTGLKIKQTNTEWSNVWDPCEVSIIFNLEKNRIIIFSKENQIFDIDEYLPIRNEDDYRIYSMRCNDTDYKKCTIFLYYYYDISNYKAIHIRYSDVEYSYKLY